MKQKLIIATMVALSAGTGSAQATMFSLGNADNNFTMLGGGNARSSGGNRVGGTNDVAATWDGTLNTSVETAVVNMTISSQTPFFSALWTAHDVKVFGAGTYTVETCLADGSTTGGVDCDGTQSREMTMTVDEGQIGVHMLFDWNTSVNIDVMNVWNVDSQWGGAPQSGETGFNANWLEVADVCGWAYSNANPLPPAECDAWVNHTWYLTSTDDDGDGEFGIGMTDGPFKNFNANFNLRAPVSTIPVPAAVWLFGSGLLGMIGVMRRKT